MNFRSDRKATRFAENLDEKGKKEREKSKVAKLQLHCMKMGW